MSNQEVSIRCRFGFHKYIEDSRMDNSINSYQHCSRCEQRRVVRSRQSYTPIDWCWIRYGFPQHPLSKPIAPAGRVNKNNRHIGWFGATGEVVYKEYK